MKSDVPEYQRISLAFFHGCFLTCLSSFPIIILTFLVWSDISVCPNIIKPHFSLKNQGGVEKTPYVLLYIKRIILTSLKLGEVAVRLPASVSLLGWYGWLAWAVGLPTINGLLRFLFVAHA